MAFVYAITADLFFAERFERALQQLGHRARVIDLSGGPAPEALPAGVDLALVDLEAGPAALELVRQARSAGVKVLAFGPHVDAERRQAAQEAGADRVVTKSKLTASFAQLIASML
jgi:DNA-binding NarL/FixJ family response regulator